jgi:hypothetical protein
MSTGQFVPNMIRSGPNASIMCRTQGRMESIVQRLSAMPKPDTFADTCSTWAS